MYKTWDSLYILNLETGFNVQQNSKIKGQVAFFITN